MEVPPTILRSKGEKTMTGNPILSRFQVFGNQFQAVFRPQSMGWPDLHTLWLHPERLPIYAAETPVVKRTLDLLGPLDWKHFPERNLARRWCHPAVSYAAFAGAMLVKLNEGQESMGDLRQYLVEHPGLIPLLGFRAVRSRVHACGFDPDASLPTQRHLTRMLRETPNSALQFLLADSVRLIREELRQHQVEVGECISLVQNIFWPLSRRTIRKPTSKTASTKPSNPRAIRTASWAARDAITRKRSSPWDRIHRPHPIPTRNPAKRSRLASSFGAMARAWW